MNQYKAVVGSMLDDEKAQRYGEYLEALAEEQGKITPDIVVDDARNENSPLHDFFEWDLEIAARGHWKQQARNLIGSINVIVKVEDRQIETRAWCHVFVTEHQEQNYQPIIRVMSDVDMRKQMLETAIRELDTWRKKYEQYKELSPIFETIAQIKLGI